MQFRGRLVTLLLAACEAVEGRGAEVAASCSDPGWTSQESTGSYESISGGSPKQSYLYFRSACQRPPLGALLVLSEVPLLWQVSGYSSDNDACCKIVTHNTQPHELGDGVDSSTGGTWQRVDKEPDDFIAWDEPTEAELHWQRFQQQEEERDRGHSKPGPAHGYGDGYYGEQRRARYAWKAGQDPWEILDVAKGASSSELRKAYRRQALIWHPDKHGNSAQATDKFAALRAAFELLVDPSERQAFEKFQQASESSATISEEGRTDEEVEKERTEDVAFFYGQAGQRGEVDMLNAATFAIIQAQALAKVEALWSKFDAVPPSLQPMSPRMCSIWLLQFYAPWCPHCQNLKPYFLFAGSKLQKRWGDSLRVGVVDCVENKEFCESQNIASYPEIRAFAFGVGADGNAMQEESNFEEHTNVHYSLIPGRIVNFVKQIFQKFDVRSSGTHKARESAQIETELEQLRKEVEQLRVDLHHNKDRVRIVEAENEQLKAALAEAHDAIGSKIPPAHSEEL